VAGQGSAVNILSIQSWVAYGHVGNASAMFPLQRLGAEVRAVNTVQFSNHTGYGAWTGQVFEGAAVRDLVDGIAARGVLPSCDAVLSGYMGDPGIGDAILGAVARVRAANPAALYCCDPVIGEHGRGVFVRPGIPELMRDQAVPAADILTPNQFELEHLTARPIATLDAARHAVSQVRSMMAPGGPKVVLVTSLQTDDTPPDAVDMLAADADGVHLLRTPLLPISVNGAGDAVAALFLYHYLRSRQAQAALEAAGSAIHGLLRRTAEAGSREILTVAAQDEFVSPSVWFRSQQS
jgi:pyridoxine kinase